MGKPLQKKKNIQENNKENNLATGSARRIVISSVDRWRGGWKRLQYL